MAQKDEVVKNKEKLLRYFTQGYTIEEAMRSIGKSPKTYEYYRSSDKEFKEAVDRIRAAKVSGGRTQEPGALDIGFKEFRKTYLESDTFPHQMNIIDLLEGREPEWLHPSMVYEKGSKNYILVNVPPEHAKSMTTSIDYPVYRIAMDPNVRIMIVSKSQQKATEFIYAIKQRLTHPAWQKLQLAYAAGSGFKSKSATWQATQVYLGEELRDSDQKDPTIQALGIGGQVYGARADLIILDDCVTMSNAHEYEKHIRWIQQEVLTRLGPTGKLLILGTRVDAIDLYREIRNPERYPTGVSPWTYLSMPAVLEFGESIDEWVTLWPKSDRPWQGSEDQPDENGLYPRWNGHYLSGRRSALDPKTWSMVYQQADVDEDSTFNLICVKGSIDKNRMIGPIVAGNPGHPEEANGLTVIAGLDPAIVGDTAAVVMAIDHRKRKRYVLDAVTITRPSPQAIRDLITTLTEKYHPSEWMVERNAFQGYLTQDEGLRQWLANRGVILREHTTNRNKWDVGFGVAAMAPLFGSIESETGKHHRDNLIHLPSDRTEGIRLLIDQLITWSPDTKNKTDLVMALWFCEIRARELCQSGSYGGHFTKNEFLSRADQQKRQVINLNEWDQSRRLA